MKQESLSNKPKRDSSGEVASRKRAVITILTYKAATKDGISKYESTPDLGIQDFMTQFPGSTTESFSDFHRRAKLDKFAVVSNDGGAYGSVAKLQGIADASVSIVLKFMLIGVDGKDHTEVGEDAPDLFRHELHIMQQVDGWEGFPQLRAWSIIKGAIPSPYQPDGDAAHNLNGTRYYAIVATQDAGHNVKKDLEDMILYLRSPDSAKDADAQKPRAERMLCVLAEIAMQTLLILAAGVALRPFAMSLISFHVAK